MNEEHSSEHEKEFLRLTQGIRSSPERYKEAITKALASMRDLKAEFRAHSFDTLFSDPRSFWTGLMQERDEIIRTVFGEEEFQSHPHRRELEIMLLVKLGELTFMRQEAELVVRMEKVLGDLSPERKLEKLREQLRAAGIEPAV